MSPTTSSTRSLARSGWTTTSRTYRFDLARFVTVRAPRALASQGRRGPAPCPLAARLHETRPATVHQVHHTIRTLNEAVRRGHLPLNPANIARAPRVVPPDIEPFTVEEIRRLFLVTAKSRNGVRWVLALALGLRQGEALGLRWADIDLDNGVLTARRSLLRPKYGHGCGSSCGKARAGYCAARVRVNPETDTTKSRAGNRQVGLPAQLVALLAHHRLLQQEEQAHAGSAWLEGGWGFTTETGEPINPRTDWSHWKALLQEADIRDGRLHDARHTAATVLLMLGVSQPTIRIGRAVNVRQAPLTRAGAPSDPWVLPRTPLAVVPYRLSAARAGITARAAAVNVREIRELPT